MKGKTETWEERVRKHFNIPKNVFRDDIFVQTMAHDLIAEFKAVYQQGRADEREKITAHFLQEWESDIDTVSIKTIIGYLKSLHQSTRDLSDKKL